MLTNVLREREFQSPQRTRCTENFQYLHFIKQIIKLYECLHPSAIPKNNQAVDISLTVQVRTGHHRKPPPASEIPHIKMMHTHKEDRQSLLHLQFLNYFSTVKVMASTGPFAPISILTHTQISFWARFCLHAKPVLHFLNHFAVNILRLFSWSVLTECWGSLF